MYFPRWWIVRPDPKVKAACIRALKHELAHNKAMLTTPDYIETVLDSEGIEQPWNDETKDAIQADITAIEAELAAWEG